MDTVDFGSFLVSFLPEAKMIYASGNNAPQKLGIDVVVDKINGQLVTLEVNGELSGYQGMNDLGIHPEHSIVSCIGLRSERKSILVHPWIHDFYGDKRARGIEPLRTTLRLGP